MGIQRYLIALLAFTLCTAGNALAASYDNPFDKGISVEIGKGADWVIKDRTATLSGSDSGNYYHLHYDRKQLRLRITGDAQDSDAAAKNYKQFAVEDVRVDGTRLPVFQWCLNNQQKHSRFLQQGLTVKNDICVNQGAAGAFYMRLNMATLKLLEQGKELVFTIKPFRTSMDVVFDISGFSSVSAQLKSPVKKAVEPVKAKAAPAAVAPVAAKKCKARPPQGFVEVKAIEYNCDDAVARSMAESSIGMLVKKEKERRQKAAAENERRRLAAEEARKKEEEARKAAEAAAAAEQAAIAASLAQQEAISNEIANKMIGVCQKKWAKGEHRCYCEKYLEHAPPGIKSDPSCGG